MEKEKLKEEYKAWILKRIEPEYLKAVTESPEDAVYLESEYASGSVVFNSLADFMITELRIISKKDGESVFYLHFELNDPEHAKELFDEMYDALKRQKDEGSLKVLFCCSSAITTSYFKERMKEASELLGMSMEFDAVSLDRLYVKGFEADVVLLAPQISYELENAKKVLKNRIVEKIPAQIFACYDVRSITRFIEGLVKKADDERNGGRAPLDKISIALTPPLLIINVIVEYQQVRLVYRVYGDGKSITQDTIMKSRFALSDLKDILDVVMNRYPYIEMVCVSMPGVLYQGRRLTFRTSEIYDVDVLEMFEGMYEDVTFIFSNDANAMALGYYTLQNDVENLAFYFHPRASRTCGVGNIVNGRLMIGAHGIAGEMQYSHQVISYSSDPEELAVSVKGTEEIVVKYLLTVIAASDPELVVIHCDLVPDVKRIRERLGEYMQKEFIPRLVKVDDCIEYMFSGGIMLCREKMNEIRKNRGDSA